MAVYRKNIVTGGKWAVKSELYEKKITKAVIVSETNPEPSTFSDSKGNPQTQDVCKCKFEGMTEPLKISLNQATINGLVDAFGEDSKNWQNKELSLEIDKLPGKKFPLYLIPESYKRVEDDNGYSVIVREGDEEIPTIEIEPENLPFS